MTSAIDATKPVAVTPTTASVRANFLAAYNEITALQADRALLAGAATQLFKALNLVEGYTAIVTAAGTTVLTVASTYLQYLTGTSTQTFTLPDVTTLTLGHSFYFDNDSTGDVTVNSSGSNLVQSFPAGSFGTVTCVAITGTGAASWSSSITISANYAETIVLSTAPVTLTTTATTYNVATLALPKGTWLVQGSVGILHGTVDSQSVSGISITSATLPNSYEQEYQAIAFSSGSTYRSAVPSKVVVMAAAGSVYLVSYAAFTGTSPVAYGKIFATRLSA